MYLKETCVSRRIVKIDVETPLIVPSFSSVAPAIPLDVHTQLKEHLPEASLVSAYDLFYGHLKEQEIWVSDVVFIDSGVYEATPLKRERTSSILSRLKGQQKDWSLSKYEKVIRSLEPLTRAVLVNYDERNTPQKQISDARAFFARHPGYAACFLYKPRDNMSKVVDIQYVVDNASSIASFDIIGLTEKELGESLLARCRNILRIREALNSKKLNTPVHVFGCLDPLSIIVYFLCGADIFDGTSWLKFSFHENTAIYTNNYGLITGSWSSSDSRIQATSLVLNLNELTRLMHGMRRFTQDHDFSTFRLSEPISNEIRNLTRTAGVNY